MVRRGILWGIAGCLAAVAAALACASDGDDSEATGTLGATCYPDDTCDEGLVCKADRCLAPSGNDASSAGGASNTGGSSGRGGGAGSGGTDDAGSGGSSASAGRGGSGGVSGAGGTIGSGGRGGTGGIASTGGAGGRGSAGTGGTAGTGGVFCEPQSAPSECDGCVQANCCEEWLACTDFCADEMPCIVQCSDAAWGQNGFVDLPTLSACASSCAEGPVIAATTEALFSCILGTDPSSDASTTGCALECFGLE